MQKLTKTVLKYAHSFNGVDDLDPLIKQIAGSRMVLLGEASHGTLDFYHWRSKITERLIKDHGFKFVAAEADWPPSTVFNDYCTKKSQFTDATEALCAYSRWPTWMWSNETMVEFGNWLKEYNQSVKEDKKAYFHGFDVYSLFESIEVVLKHLEKLDPELAENARHRYSCFEPYNRDEKAYLRSLAVIPEGCRCQAITELKELLQIKLNGDKDKSEKYFDAVQNARIVKNAEEYYHTMIEGGDDSWNVRDKHMTEITQILLEHYGPNSKGIIWAHNTHVGDYKATSMVEEGQINVGGLVREWLGPKNVSIVGFGTYTGTVIASHKWGGPTETMPVPQGKPGSVEGDFHEVCKELQCPRFYLSFDEFSQSDRKEVSQVREHRAIGVVYHPAFERYGNYVKSKLAQRYDHFIFIDHSRALKPLSLRQPNKNQVPREIENPIEETPTPTTKTTP